MAAAGQAEATLHATWQVKTECIARAYTVHHACADYGRTWLCDWLPSMMPMPVPKDGMRGWAWLAARLARSAMTRCAACSRRACIMGYTISSLCAPTDVQEPFSCTRTHCQYACQTGVQAMGDTFYGVIS